MAALQYRPSTDLFSPLFEDLLAGPLSGVRRGGLLRAPEADVVETETEIRVMLEMPGMKAEDLDIGLENNVLTISGEKRQEHSGDEEKNTWHIAERRYGQFSRSFVLPRDVDAERIQARFDAGVLNVTVPKSERARRRRIEVHDGAEQPRVGVAAAR